MDVATQSKDVLRNASLVIQCWRSQKRPKALGQISLTVALHSWIDTLRSRFWSEFFIL